MNNLLDTFSLSGKTIGVAVSGGKDSMALLTLLEKEKEKLNINLCVINVEHGIRGEESIGDSKFVEEQAKAKNLPFYPYTVSVLEEKEKLGLSVEETARVLRRHCFDDAYSKGLCDYIATAHHADDLVESVLLNLFRGTSVKGLKGISAKTDYIIRPLLHTKKSEIDEFVKKHDIPFREDSTNNDSAYTRNYLRNEILPNLKERFPSLTDGVLRLSKIVESEDNYLDSLAKRFVFNDNGIIKIDLKCESQLLPRAIILALKEIGIKKDYEKKHADMLADLSTKLNGTKLSLIGGVTAVKEYGVISLYYESEIINLSMPFSLGEFSYQGKTYIIEKADSFINNDKTAIYLDLDKIPKSAIIRNRTDGDRFKPYNAKTKKLKDYFIDKKIPVRIRNSFPILAIENTVLAILGLEISDQVKIDNNTKNIVKISVKE